jgi:translocation and assembly module TamB
LSATLRLPQAQLREARFTAIQADINIVNQRATLSLAAKLSQATVRVRASVNLSGNYYAEAALDSTKMPLDTLLACSGSNPPDGFRGETETHGTFKGPLRDRSRWEAHLTIPIITAGYQSLEIASVRPIHVDYANSALVIEPGELRGTETSVRFGGRISTGSTDAVSFAAQGSVNMRLLQIFSSDLQSSGTVALDFHAEGSPSRPAIRGQIRLQNIALLASTTPLGLEGMNGILDVADDQVRISQLTGQVGGGQLSAGGSVRYRPQLQFNVALQANSVRLRYPEGIRTALNGTLTFIGNRQDAALAGQILIDGLSFTSDFDLASLVNQFGATVPSAGQSFGDRVKLNVRVQSSDELSAANAQVSLQGQANLRLIGTATNPVVVGRADLNSGDIFFMKQRYQLERGIINFTNPARTEPVVNILMTTTIKQYNLTLTVTGPINNLRTSYTSDPPLPPADIISLIARGQTNEQSTPASMGANTILAQGLASQVSSSVEKLAGLSSLQIDPLLGGNNRNPSARVAVQKRVTKNFIFTFSTDVTNPQSEVIQGEYQINKRWSVSAARDEGGGVAVDGRYHTTF